MSKLNPLRIIHELRRRKVFNTVAIFIAGAWIALQVAEQAFPALDIPDRAIRFIWLGSFLLFPLVVVFGWRYDISKDGINRTAPEDAPGDIETSLKGLDHWFIGSLLVLALAVTATMLFEISRVEPEDMVVVVPQENSIAVMPFGICEDRTSDRPLAGGLTGEVISRLAQRDRLKVMGSSTSFNLASFGSSSQEISNLTKTQYVLTGTLCRDGIDLQLEAEMKDADGFIVWRESFTEVTNQFDQVEKRLAQQVANGVALELGDVIRDARDNPVNRLALEQLLIGREHARQGNEDKAREAFNKSLEYQPEFAEAVWELTDLEWSSGGLENVGTSIEKAWPLGEQALDLALAQLERGVPDFDAHRIAGQIIYELAIVDQDRVWRTASELGEEEVATRQQAAQQQLLKAEQHFRSALLMNPSATRVRSELADNLRRQGVHRNTEALEIMEEGWNFDPFNPVFGRQLANFLAGNGEYRRAMEILDRFEALPQGKRPLYWIQLEIMNNYGRYDDKLAALIEILESDPEGMRWGAISQLWWIVGQIRLLGLVEEAGSLYRQVEQIPYPERREWVTWAREFFLVDHYLWATGQNDILLEKELAKISGMSNEQILDAWHVQAYHNAQVLWEAGQRERAIELFEGLRHVQQGLLWQERQASGTLSLAEMYILVDLSDDAAPLLKEAIGHLEEEFEAGIRHPETLSSLAMAYSIQEDDKKALDMLNLAVDYGFWTLLIDLEMSEPSEMPWLERLQDDPRFTQTVNRMRSIRDLQAANVRNLLSQYDMDALLEPLIRNLEREMEEWR